MNQKKLVTVKTCAQSHETAPYEAALKSAQIAYVINNEIVDASIVNAVGGIIIKVEEKNAKEALKIISSIEEVIRKSYENDIIYIEGKKHKKIIVEECPECQSDEVYVETQSFGRWLVNFSRMRNFYCEKCHHSWKARNKYVQ